MRTKVITIDPQRIDLAKIKIAAEVIRGGGLVAFPTETVYGLGADAFNTKAVARVFEAKQRPLDDPLIVHIASPDDLHNLVLESPRVCSRLIGRFWPGPLTLILKKSRMVPDIVTAGLDTVAVRMPANLVALNLIEEARTPVAAPSANLFGRPSPTSARHVLDDLDGRIDILIDGGSTSVGVESTVLDLTVAPPQVLRPGGVIVEELEKLLVDVRVISTGEAEKEIVSRSPGIRHTHYSPRADLVVVEGDNEPIFKRVKKLATRFRGQGRYVGIMATEENKDKYNSFFVKTMGRSDDLRTCAAGLFSTLRDFDREGVDIIIAEGLKEQGLGLAIMDRLRKASSEIARAVEEKAEGLKRGNVSG